MLSRIAESLFWIGRYVERADDTARILDVHMQMLLETGQSEESAAGRASWRSWARRCRRGRGDRGLVLERLAYDPASTSSIVGAIGAARENARRARETVSTELWECLNTTYIGSAAARMRATTPPLLRLGPRAGRPGRRDHRLDPEQGRRVALPRSGAQHRARGHDRTAGGDSAIGPAQTSWSTLLRSCGAYESYVRTYRGVDTDERAAEFLLLDRLFPRSVLYALTKAEESLAAFPDHGPGRRQRPGAAPWAAPAPGWSTGR